MNDFKVILEAMIDNSSLTNIQKQLAKERLKVSADIDFSNFVSEKQKIQQLANEINKILGDSLQPKEALSWANQYWKQMQSGAKQATKEQEKLNQAQKKNSLETQEKYYKRIIDNNKTIYALKEKMLTADKQQKAEIQRQITLLEKRNQYNANQLSKKGLTDNSWEFEVNSSKEVLESRLRINQEKQKDIALSKQIADVNKIQHLSSTGSFAKQVSDATVEYNKLSTVTDDLKADFAELQRLQTVLGTSQTDEELISNYEKFNTTLEKVKNSMHILRNEQNGLGIKTEINASQQAIDSLANSMLTFRDNNTKMTKDMKTRLNNMYHTLTNGANLSQAEVDELRTRFNQLKLEVRDVGKLGKSFGDSIKQGMSSFATWLPATTLIMSGVSAIRGAIDNVRELDDSLLELSKVSNLSADGLTKVTKEAYELGETVGKTGTQVLNAVTEFKRAGFELEDSMSLAEDALKMTNVAEGINEASESAQYLISIMKGYKDTSIEFSEKILDSINEVSNTQAVDFDNLADGAQRLSAVANQANVSFDQMLGVLTGGYEVLGNMEKTASGLITIFTRLQSIQLSDEEDVESVAKLQKTFSSATKGVVNIVDQTTGQLRSAYDILNDLNTVWNTLDKNTQEGLAFAAGGTRQKSVFLSIMNNWESVEKSVLSATDSMGSAEEENRKYLESISGKVSQFDSAVEQLSSTIINSDLIKFFVDLGTTGVKAIDGIVNALGGLGTIGLLTGAGLGIKNIGRPKMFGLVLKYADNYKCSLGY